MIGEANVRILHIITTNRAGVTSLTVVSRTPWYGGAVLHYFFTFSKEGEMPSVKTRASDKVWRSCELWGEALVMHLPNTSLAFIPHCAPVHLCMSGP